MELYQYKSNNTIAYKTGSGDELNVKRRDAESDGDDQVVNWPVRPLSMEGIDGPQGSGTGPAAKSLFVHSPLLPRIAKMKADGYGVFCRCMYND